MWVLMAMMVIAANVDVPSTIDIRDGKPVAQQYLRGNPAYLAVGVLAGVGGAYQEGGVFDKVYLFKQGEDKKKNKYDLVGIFDLGYINGIPAGLDLAAGDVDGDRKDELGVSVRVESTGTKREIGLILLRPSESGLGEIWRLAEGAPQLEDLDGDSKADVGQLGSWEQPFIKDNPVRYLSHIYRWKGKSMVLDDGNSIKVFHTAREKARGMLEMILAGKGNSDVAFRSAAEVFLVGRKDSHDLANIWKLYEKPLKDRLSGEQWNALKKLKP